jgi:glycosyltransferase involved in cell wall biosynthesis
MDLNKPSRAAQTPMVVVLGLPDSVHTARWLNMVRGRGIRFVLLPVYFGPVCPEIESAQIISDLADADRLSDRDIGIFDLDSVPREETASRYEPWRPEWLGALKLVHPGLIACAIRRLRPDIIHSMIVQFGGYLALAAKDLLKAKFPLWLLSNWGSDIYLYRKLPEHESRILEILAQIDGYHSECERDLRIARRMGFRGFAFPCIPASGGSDFSKFPPPARFERPSHRREIVLKGYHGWSGRALHILAAVHMAADALRDFKIRLTLGEEAVNQTVNALASADGLDIVSEVYLNRHEDVLTRLGQARVVVGMGISDGISTTLLEAMAVGTFPIQGCNSCGDEWIEPGRTGFLISPHDVDGLARAIRRAVEDDEMVDQAAPKNRETVMRRWNAATNGEIAVRNYRALLESAATPQPIKRLRSDLAGDHA